ncbi:MAG: CHRD domain-containing protein [Candidatus Caldarchaeales archaeon]|jgi:hypothetical protein|nr:CHRD domain-containing protein [Candidatus Caldarchaeales archaeon]
MRRKLFYSASICLLMISLLILIFATNNAPATVGGRSFTATLSGYNEAPSVVSKGFGWARVLISEDGKSISYELTYYGLSGVTMAHIHIGREGHVGGVAVWLCGGPRPPCPPSSGTVRGVITSSDVLAIGGQGLEAGDLDALIAAIRAGAAYVNVHTSNFPAGEIRGQLNTS